MNDSKNINVNSIDGNILLVSSIYNDINKYWIKEINSDGDSFNYDSQDIYRHALDNIFLLSEFIEKINPETHKEERRIVINELKKSVKENIKLFENFRSLFADLSRKKLLIREFKNRKYSKSTKSDGSLYKIFVKQKELQNREIYFNSNLYKNIGYIEHNFHEELYDFAIYLKSQIKKDFEPSNTYNSNYLGVHNNTFFNMGIVYHIHNSFNNIAFYEVNELKLYKALNLQNTLSYIRIKDNQKLLYIIYRLSEILDENYRADWLKGILKEIRVTKEYYNKKYKAVTWKNSSADQQTFVEQFDILFKDKIAPILS